MFLCPSQGGGDGEDPQGDWSVEPRATSVHAVEGTAEPEPVQGGREAHLLGTETKVVRLQDADVERVSQRALGLVAVARVW